jgi:hypothetical protein
MFRCALQSHSFLSRPEKGDEKRHTRQTDSVQKRSLGSAHYGQRGMLLSALLALVAPWLRTRFSTEPHNLMSRQAELLCSRCSQQWHRSEA